MLDRKTIHNSAMLKPKMTKRRPQGGCSYFRQYRKHATHELDNGNQQCVMCGKIIYKRADYGLHY